MKKKRWQKITAWIVIISFSALETSGAQPMPVSELLQGGQPEKTIEENVEPSLVPEDGFFVSDSLGFLENNNPLNRPHEEKASPAHPPHSDLLPQGGEGMDAAKHPNDEILRPSPMLQRTQNDKEGTEGAEGARYLNQPTQFRYLAPSREPERLSFEEAMEELRPEYASAVIVKGMTAENLKQLTDLPFEVAVLVLHGEIVLVTSGSEDEIGVLPAVRDLIEKADFVSHTHPGKHSAEGPSGQDLNEAVEAPREEYVLTHQGVYVYNQNGLLYDGEVQSYERYLSRLAGARFPLEACGNDNGSVGENDCENEIGYDNWNGVGNDSSYLNTHSLSLRGSVPFEAEAIAGAKHARHPDSRLLRPASNNRRARNDKKSDHDKKREVQARQDLNLFIAEQDRYNTAAEEERITFRRGGTLTYTSGLTSSSVTTLSGSPYPYIAAGSTAATALAVSSNQFSLGYSVPGASDSSGFTISFDNATTATVETRSISTLANLTFGLKGPNTSVKFEIIDINNVKDTFTLTNIVNTAERFWRIPVSAISNTLDKTKIKQINFGVGQANTTSATRAGMLYIRTSGLNTNAPAKPAVAITAPNLSNQNTVTLFGTKDAHTSLWIGSTPIVPRDGATTWTATVNLPKEGDNALSITAKNTIGKVSAATSWTVKRDTVAPTGTLNIASGAIYASAQNVTLNLSASDDTGGSGRDKMSFSNDGASWSEPEIFAVSKSYQLPEGDGVKTVYAKFYDKAGNTSPVYSKSITLDTLPPEGTVSLNGDDAYTASNQVTVNLNVSDAGAGVYQMKFSSDGGTTWSFWEAFAANKTLTLPAGDGEKEVRVLVKDKTGKVASFSDKIVLAANPLVFTSASNTTTSAYALTYTVNGQARTENWQLAPGVNDLFVRIEGTPAVYAKHTVTLNQTAPTVPAMPAVPVLPESLLSVTTEDGLILKYDQDVLKAVENPGQYELFYPELDASGNLTGGMLHDKDGGRLLFKDSKPVYKIAANGEKTYYDADGTVRSFESAQGAKTRFAYRLDEAGNSTALMSLEDNVSSLYEDQAPAWIQMTDGTGIRYAGGFLTEYKDAAGNTFFYQTAPMTVNEAVTGYLSQLASVKPAGTTNNIPWTVMQNNLASYPSIKTTFETKLSLELEYDKDKVMKRVKSGMGETLQLQGGLPLSLTSSSGTVTGLLTQTDAQGAISGVELSGNGLKQIFDQLGKLQSITLSDGTVLTLSAEKLQEIQMGDGSVLEQILWDGQNPTDFIRTKPDGTKETYTAGHIVRKEEPNGNVTTFFFDTAAQEDKPNNLITADGRTYHFIEFKNAQGLKDRITELTKVDLPDGSKVEFERGKPVRFVVTKEIHLSAAQVPLLPQGQAFIAEYDSANVKFRALTIDAAGNILSGELLFKDGTQYFIENGELVKQITPDGQIVAVRQEDPEPLPTFEAIPPKGYSNQELAYRDELVNQQLDFFMSGIGIDPKTGFPMDNFDAVTGQQSTYSQATLVGMWAEILSAIALGHWVTPKISKNEALQKLDQMLQNLVYVQEQAGWNGMFSFFGISEETRPILDSITGLPTGQTETVTVYKRQFNDIGIGDNLNLSVSLNSVIGAIGLINDPALNTQRDSILGKCYHIVWKQDTGYDKFYDPVTKRFRMAYQFNADGTGQFAGHMDRVFNEFRPGLIWLASAKPQYREAIENLDVAVRAYTTADGQTIDNAVPWDGGAFQMFWPLMHVDETQYAEFDVALKNFMVTQAEYIQQHGIPGLLSAGSDPGKGYNGKMGMPEASETDDPLETRVGSIYGTASAFLLAPHYTLQLLKNIESAFPGVKTSKGYADSLKLVEVSQTDPVTGQVTVTTQPVFSQQYYGVDQASFMLSFMGTSRSYFKNYLTWQGIDDEFDGIYKSMIFGLAPAAQGNPEPPQFGAALQLFTGQDPDGYSHPLVKRPGFIETVTDPDYGEGRIYDYSTPNGQFHHTAIEFEGRSFGFQEYILLPGRGDRARSLTAGLRFDLLNEGKAEGAFYTPEQGYASGALTLDPELGEARRLDFDFHDVNHAVGLWTQYENLDLTQYDYLAVPLKLGEGTKPGTRLKFELKGMGEVYVSPALTTEWQYVQIPIVKPADPLKEIAAVVQMPDGQPAQGQILMGPLSAFKVRTSNQLDWGLLSGYADTELRNLLKQKALNQPGGGGTVTAEESLEDFIIDSSGKLIDGVLKRADGSIQYFHKGRLSKWVFRDGRTVLFEKGLATFIVDLSRGRLEEGRYYYEQDFRGKIKSFVLQDNDRKRVYGADGKLLQMIDGGSIVNFKDGGMDNIVLPDGVISNLVFNEDQSLLSAHVKTAAGAEFDIQQYGDQMIERANGVKVYYSGQRIVAIETPQNGRADFTYTVNAVGQLLGVNATFREEITDSVTGQPVMVTREKSLFEYLQRPERSLEKGEILREDPLQIIPRSGVGGFSIFGISPPEQTYALNAPIDPNNSFPLLAQLRAGEQPQDQAGYLFQYQNVSGTTLGAYFKHPDSPVTVSDYDFLNITLRQSPDMNWNQDFNLKLKTPQSATLFNFQLQNATSAPQTFAFPLNGKLGTEGEMTLEVIRETGGVGKQARIYIQDISYLALKTVEKPLWENLLSISSSEIQHLKRESQTLTSVGAEIATGKPLIYENLAPMLDLPTWVTYADQSPTETGKLTGFKRFDGSEVTVEGTSVSKIILPDGTVNEYSTAASGAQSGTQESAVIPNTGADAPLAQSGVHESFVIARSPRLSADDEAISNSSAALNYHYGALRKVTQPDGRKLDFSYEFDTDGKEITIIADSTTGDTRRFKDGKLIQSTASDKRQTAYQYENGELVSSEIMYKNRVLDSMHYAYTPEETQVTDERGTTWYYNANGDLTKHLTKDGYLFEYIEYTQTLEGELILDPDDFKNKIFNASDLSAIRLNGYESQDGSQVLFDGAGTAEIKLATGEHAVNLVIDGQGKIKNGQIQFADGAIMVIENYLPVSGRSANGEVFEIAYPAGGAGEILLNPDGTFQQIRIEKDGKYYFYDPQQRLIAADFMDGRKYGFTYTSNAQNQVTAYQQIEKRRLVFRGVSYPTAFDLVREGSGEQRILKMVSDGQEAGRYTGANGFTVGVSKAGGQWDVQTGSLSSPADRFALKKFLEQIKPGESVAAMISDANFATFGNAEEREEFLAFFEQFGAGQIRAAAAGNQDWSFFGVKGLPVGEANEQLSARGSTGMFSSETQIETSAVIAPNSTPVFETVPLLLNAPAPEFNAWARFMERYENHKPDPEIQALTVYNSGDELVFARRIDGVATYYEAGKAREIYGETGELLYRYTYNDAGDQTRIEVIKAKTDFKKNAAKLRERMEQEKFDALYRLAWQDEAARLKIKEEVENGLRAIDNGIAQLQALRYQTVKQCGRGFLGIGKKCKTSTFEVPGVGENISRLERERADLIQRQQEELAKISTEVGSKRTEVEDQISGQMTQLDEEEKQFEEHLLHQEMEPVLISFYRKILGRDPSIDEINQWIDLYRETGAVDTDHVAGALTASAEHTASLNQKQTIISAVETFLNAYLAETTENGRAAWLSQLGISASETVELDAAETKDILDWLETRDLHFGQSAFLSLKEMLKSQGSDVAMNTIAKESILIDILTGTLNRFTEGELLISIFALSRTAKIHGQDIAGVKYNFEDLKALYASVCPDPAESCSLRIIAHIAEDHFVVITHVTETEIRYLETTKGTSGEEVTVPAEEFRKVWEVSSGHGYLIVALPQVIQAKRITDKEAQSVRGAFFWLIFLAIAALIVKVVTIVYAIVTFIISTIIAVVTAVLDAVVSALGFIFTKVAEGVSLLGKSFFNLGKLLYQGIKFAGRFVMKGFQFLKDGFAKGLSRLGSKITKIKNFLLKPSGKPIVDALGHNILDANGNILRYFSTQQVMARQMVGAAIGAGSSKVLEGLGVNPAIANLASAFVSGGFLGTGSAMSGFLKSGLQQMIMQGVSEIGLKIGLPPPITSALSLITGNSLKAYFDPSLTLKQALVDIVPQITAQLSLSSLELVGRSLGVNPIFSKLIGLPFASGLAGLVGGLVNKVSPADLFGVIKQTIIQGTASGLISIGASLALEQLGVSSNVSTLITNYLGKVLAGEAIGGAISKAGQSVISKIAAGILRFGNVVKNAAGVVLNFGQKVLQKTGQFTEDAFKKTLGLFSPLFGRKAQESIYQDLAGIRQGSVSVNGDVWTWRAGNEHVSYNTKTDSLIGGSIDEIATITGLGEVEGGGLTYDSLTYEDVVAEGMTVKNTFERGLLRDLSAYYSDIEVFQAAGSKETGIIITEGGQWISEDIGLYRPTEIPLPDDFEKPANTDVKAYLPIYVWFETDNGWLVDADFTIEKRQIESASTKELYVLTNGILNPEPTDAPGYLSNLREDIIEQSQQKVGAQDFIFAHTFHASFLLKAIGLTGFADTIADVILGKLGGPVSIITEELLGKLVEFSVNLSKDLRTWTLETADPHAHAALATDIETALEDYFQDKVSGERERNIVAVGFSGGFLPLVEVLQNAPKQEGVNSGYKTKSVVALGAVTTGVEELMLKMVEAGDMIRRGKLTREALDTALQSFIAGGVQFGAITIEKIKNFLVNKQSEEAYQEYKKTVEAMTLNIKDFAEASLLGTSAEMVVNVYGTKDAVADLQIDGKKLGGYRSELLGHTPTDRDHTLFNIEIVGAGHNDYIRNDLGSDLLPIVDPIAGILGYAASIIEHQWNLTVSEFVADLLVASKSKESLKDFLTRNKFVKPDETKPGSWAVYLPGYQNRQ